MRHPYGLFTEVPRRGVLRSSRGTTYDARVRKCSGLQPLASWWAGEGRERRASVLIFVDVRVDPKEMSQDELWEAWEEEANAALAAKDAGTVVALYKVCG
jgi:hypothetical protein